MQFERKHYIYIILAILLSLIAIDGTGTIINYNNYTNGSSNGSFYNDINMNENNITEVTELRNNGTLYTPYINLGSSKIELGTKFLGSPLKMWDLQITGMNAYYNLNMNNKSLLNCLNCANKTELNEKVNKSGDNITGDINILNAYFNITTNKTMNFDFNSIPMLKRNQSSATYRTALLTSLNMMLEISDGGIGNGGGPAITFFNKENQSRGGAELNIGRFGIGWNDKVSNTSKYSFYYRSSVADTSALSPAFYVYGNGTEDFSTTRPVTFETGNLKLTNRTGTGYEFACFDSNGNLIRSLVSCDLI